MGTSTICTCTPGTRDNGWHETRCAACSAADREQAQASFRDFWQDVAGFPGDFATSMAAWSKSMNARHQWALWDYLGMDRAGAWR